MPRSTTILICLSYLACWSDSGELRQDAAQSTRDSAGIRIVENTGHGWPRGHGWRLSDQPLIDIGGSSEDPDHQLYQVEDVARLSDGRW